MHVPSLDGDPGRSGVEVLVLEFSDLSAVHRVGEVGSEPSDVELHHAAAYLFVRRESDPDFPVLEFRVLHDVLDGVHYLCDPGLVVSSEEGGPVGGDQVLSHVVEQFGEFGRFEEKALDSFEGDVPAVIFPDQLGFDVLPGRIGGSVHMGYETNRGNILPCIGGDRPHHVAIFIQGGLDPHRFQLVAQDPQQVQLLRGGRLASGFFVTLRVERHVP